MQRTEKATEGKGEEGSKVCALDHGRSGRTLLENGLKKKKKEKENVSSDDTK